MRHVSTALRSRSRQVSLDDVSTISNALVKHWSWRQAASNVQHGIGDSIRFAHRRISRGSGITDRDHGTDHSVEVPPRIRRTVTKDNHIPLSSHPQPPQVPPPISAPHATRHLTAPMKIVKAARSNTNNRPLNFQFQAPPLHPHANIGLPYLTRNVATDRYHPLNIFASRRLDEWSTQSFKWNVRVDTSVSKKAVVRNWVRRRLQAAMRGRLEARGWGVNGEILTVRDVEDEEHRDAEIRVQPSRGRLPAEGAATGRPLQKRQLEGALLIVADQSLITASFPDVKERVESMLDRVVQKQRLYASEQKGPWKQRSFVRQR
ncbi:hypothetical protein KVT40_003328 [Elsinoe batatas]|uniref:Uncharacterized protein n=1 Tax=Elsinoe batatas TaxID=2601811 RepID=A0A8K0L7B6_9PEZI|nr:hypothetical protein KVT40_003328 [Elsinoe batatas]